MDRLHWAELLGGLPDDSRLNTRDSYPPAEEGMRPPFLPYLLMGRGPAHMGMARGLAIGCGLLAAADAFEAVLFQSDVSFHMC